MEQRISQLIIYILVTFNLLYGVGAYEILNFKNDSIYFSGILNPYQRAAKFSIYPEHIDVRARWETEGIKIRFE